MKLWSHRIARRPRPIRLPGINQSVFDRSAAHHGFALDAAQRAVIERLAQPSRHGYYIWGPVGRGKTWIMNTCFDALATRRKERVHFHDFFRRLHAAIIRHDFDVRAALDDLLEGIDVLCFDEFHVHDVGDAALIKRLIQELLRRPITLIVTSNYPPDGLLPNPLFHQSFVPTIELITEALDVVELGPGRDFRQDSDHSRGFSTGRWVSPGTAGQYADLGILPPGDAVPPPLVIGSRPLHVVRADGAILWLRFADLCQTPTATGDYLHLARHYRKWLISDIPEPSEIEAEPAQRFANLIDVLHDEQIQATFIAARPAKQLAELPSPPIDIARLLSRLSELKTDHGPADPQPDGATDDSPRPPSRFLQVSPIR